MPFVFSVASQTVVTIVAMVVREQHGENHH